MTEAKGPRRLLGLRRDASSNHHHHVPNGKQSPPRLRQQQQQQQQQQHRGLKNTRNNNNNSSNATVDSVHLPPHNHHQQQDKNHVVVNDDDDDAAPFLEPPSPGTPPKKLWERQYRNFLQRTTKKGDSSSTLPPPPLTNSNNTNHSTSAATAALLHLKQQQPAAAATERETSVRGGKLFGPKLFGGHASRHNSKHESSSSLAPPIRRRVQSASTADELGGTMRRGVSSRQCHPQQQQGRSMNATAATTTTTTNVSSLRSSSSTPALAKLNQQEYYHTVDDVTFLKPRFAQCQVEEDDDDDDASDITESLRTDSERSLFMVTNTTTTTAATTSAMSSMKKAFTEFHNSAESGSDAVSAFLGGDNDDSSQRDGMHWRQFHQQQSQQLQHHHHHRVRSLSSNSLSVMPSVMEGFACTPTTTTTTKSSLSATSTTTSPDVRVLRPVLGTEQWQPGRRYHMAPAVMAACCHLYKQEAAAALLWNQSMAQVHVATDDTSRFGTIVLGKCWIMYKTATSTTTTTAVQDPDNNDSGESWVSACLVLRQNYLLEFDVHANPYEQQRDTPVLPRGYAHLQYAVAYQTNQQHGSDNGAPSMIELHFFGSPCAKSDPRVVLIRVEQVSQLNTWQTFLNRAASLTIEDVYNISPEMLGKGQYSTVHKATRRGQYRHGPPVAVKLFDKNQFWRLVVKGVERADTLVRECSVQATLTAQCPDLQSFIHLGGFLETADHVILEMELVPHGTDLFKHISQRGVLPEPEAARILAQLLQVIVSMNDVGLSHRDIKPANVLLCHDDDGQTNHADNVAVASHVKLCDFGMATFCGSDGLVRGRCGTPGYVAPEIFTAGLHGGYGNKADVFSAGVTLYVILCGYEPFYGTSDDELIEANRNAVLDFPKEEWSAVSKQAIELVKSMMLVDPDKRPSASQVLANPWVRKHAPIANPIDKIQSPNANGCLIL